MKPETLVNGVIDGLISPLDRGFQYGDGLFETVLIESACATFLQEHFQRLQKGCGVLKFPEIDVDLIRNEMSQLVGDYKNGVIKITLSRGVGERGFMPPEKATVSRAISFYPSEEAVSKNLEEIALILCNTRLAKQPLLAGIKHLNQLERILARTELSADILAEGLMLDVSGLVIEGTMSNVFIVKKGVLMTPRLDQCGVSGVIRNTLIKQAAEDGIVCEQRELTLDDIREADEIFMTNSLMPVRIVKHLTIDGASLFKEQETYAKWALDTALNMIQCQINNDLNLLS